VLSRANEEILADGRVPILIAIGIDRPRSFIMTEGPS